jgi:hypothetical protein
MNAVGNAFSKMAPFEFFAAICTSYCDKFMSTPIAAYQ